MLPKIVRLSPRKIFPSDGEENAFVALCLQQIRLVIDRCDSATVTETDETSIEDRRPCEAVGETPGDAEQVNVVLPLQLGGRMRPSARYPPHVIREGFRGCLRNVVHNGQVRSVLQWLTERL